MTESSVHSGPDPVLPPGRAISLAAWQAGRFWNQLRHAVGVANVTCGQSSIDAVAEAGGELRSVVRDLAENVRAKDDLVAAVNDAVQNLLADFHSEEFGETRFQAGEDIEAAYGRGDDPRDILRELSGYSERDLTSLFDLLERQLDESGQRLFRLAIAVDCGLRSRDVLRDLDLTPLKDELDEETLAVLAEGSLPTEQTAYERSRGRLPTRLKPDCGEQPVTAAWQQDVEARWRETGLPVDRLPWRTEPTPPSGQPANAVVESVHRVAAALLAQHEGVPLDEGPETGGDPPDGGDSPEPADEEPGFLGLKLNDNSLSVSRVGYEAPVKLKSRLLFQLLEYLMRQKDGHTSLRTLQLEWIELGGREENPMRDTIDNHLYLLRTCLKPIGITIENQRNVGWRLVEIPDDSRAGAR